MQLNLLESFAEFKEFKNVDKETLMAILEEVFRNMIIKKYGSDENFDIIINPEKETWRSGATARLWKTERSRTRTWKWP